MKNIILFFIGFVLCSNLQAQITIEHSDFTLDPTGDNILLAEYDASSWLAPNAGENMTWNYSNGTQLGTSSFVFEATSNPSYPNANMRYSTTIGLAGMFFALPTYGYVNVDQQGFGYQGIDVPGAIVPLEFLTGNPADTLFHLETARTETNPWNYVSFPLNYDDSSIIVSESVQSVIVESPTFGLSYFQIDQVLTTTIEKNVIGWGNLILKNPSTSQDMTLEVLLHERIEVRVDSFFDVSGNPIPNALLNVLGLSQGSVSGEFTYYDFFAKGANYRVMRLAGPTGGSPAYSDVNLEAFLIAFNVDTEEVQPEFVNHKIYPNPIQNHQFQLGLEKNNSENWQLEVYNLIGQTVHQASITDNNSVVYLNNNLTKGHYLYAVKNEMGQVVSKGKLVL